MACATLITVVRLHWIVRSGLMRMVGMRIRLHGHRVGVMLHRMRARHHPQRARAEKGQPSHKE